MRFLVLPLALACGFQAPRIWATLWQTPAPNFDRAFLSLMQEHYEQTQNMAERSLRQIGDPQLKNWTQILIKDHQAVLREIQTELSLLGGTDVRAADVMKGEMASDWRGKLSQTYPGLMITNGFSAIGMAQQALERSKNPQVLGLARRIVAAESDRVEQLQIHLMGGR